MLQGEALRLRGKKELASFDFTTSFFGLGSARVLGVGDHVLATADFSVKTVSGRRKSEPDWRYTRDAHATWRRGTDTQSLSTEL
jgi:hypothetical protein